MRSVLRKIWEVAGSAKTGVILNLLFAVYFYVMMIVKDEFGYTAASLASMVAAGWAFICYCREAELRQVRHEKDVLQETVQFFQAWKAGNQ